MLLHDEQHVYQWKQLSNGSYLFTRYETSASGARRPKTKKEVLIPADVMYDNEPEDVLRDIVDEGGFDY